MGLALGAAVVAVAMLAADGPASSSHQAPRAGGVVSGRIIDASTLGPIPDARVQIVPATDVGTPVSGQASEPGLSVQTTETGEFHFAGVSPGTYTLTVSTVGYIFVARTVVVTTGPFEALTIPVAEGTGTYEETVTVEGDVAQSVDPGVASSRVVGSAMLQELRGVTTDDPMRALHALPGVATGDDFRAEFSIRGSAFRHLGIVVDGTPAGGLLHAVVAADNGGSVAMVNTDVLSRATLASGPHPRRYGDWLGGTLAFDVREGSRDRRGLRAAVSGTSASLVAEGPLGRDHRGSWLVSVRRSYLDWLIRQLEPDIDSTFGFADGQVKLVYDLSDRQQVQLLVLGGDAVYREKRASLSNGLVRATSGSTLASASWRYAAPRVVWTNRLSFLGAEFRNRGVLGQELARGYSQTVSFRSDAVVPAGGAWVVEAGGARSTQRMNHIQRRFVVGSSHGANQAIVLGARDISPRVALTSGWLQATRWTSAGSLTAGMRLSHRTRSEGVFASPWVLVERRAGAFTLRAGAGGSTQFADPRFTAGGEDERPERAGDVEAGVEHRATPAVTWRVSAFSRRESNGPRLASEDRLDAETGRRIVADQFPTLAASLDGSTSGVDILVARRAVQGLSGWVGYTWSRATMRDRATGETFDADFDQRHTLNVAAVHRVSYRTTISAKLRIGSNVPLVGYFEQDGDVVRLSTQRNRVRLPVYARLDLRVTRTFTFAARRLTLFVEIMNLLSRENLGQAGSSVRNSLEVVGYSERLVPFVPSVGFLIEF